MPHRPSFPFLPRNSTFTPPLKSFASSQRRVSFGLRPRSGVLVHVLVKAQHGSCKRCFWGSYLYHRQCLSPLQRCIFLHFCIIFTKVARTSPAAWIPCPGLLSEPNGKEYCGTMQHLSMGQGFSDEEDALPSWIPWNRGGSCEPVALVEPCTRVGARYLHEAGVRNRADASLTCTGPVQSASVPLDGK